MGTQQLSSYALVSMTNKDTYYISVELGRQLLKDLTTDDTENQKAFIETVDVRSGAEIGISVSNISSIVVKVRQ
jgi:hypothetical protein